MSPSTSGVSEMWGLVARLRFQLRESFDQAIGAEFPDFGRVQRIVVFGMGGSAAAADLMRGCFARGDKEIVLVRDYAPTFDLRDGDLALFSSYSGNTEEVLSSYDHVASQFPDVSRMVFSSGGELTQRAEQDGLAVWTLPPGLPPRASLGHGVGLFVALLDRLSWLDGRAQVDASCDRMAECAGQLGLDNGYEPNAEILAMAEKLHMRLPVLYAGTAMTQAVASRWRAQLNENSKALVSQAALPELNHNEVVGWGTDSPVRSAASVLALRDFEEHTRVAQRFAITRELLADSVAGWVEVRPAEGLMLARAMELVQWGDALSVVLAASHSADPMPVAIIDALKGRLASS